MFKDDDTIHLEISVMDPPRRRKWTCGAEGCSKVAMLGSKAWSYDSDDWCEPVEMRDE
jgi:hypothetical protein